MLNPNAKDGFSATPFWFDLVDRHFANINGSTSFSSSYTTILPSAD